MMNTQLKQTINKLIDCEISIDSLCQSYRIQGFTFSGLDKHLSNEICSESDRFKTYAMKKDGTYKGIGAIRQHFSITKNKENGWNEKAVLKMGTLLTSYSNYLKSVGLNPKTCKALPVKEKAVAETAVAETAAAETAAAETVVAETAVAETAVAETAVAETAVAETVELQNSIEKLEKDLDTMQQVINGKDELSQSVFSAISDILASVSEKDTKTIMLDKFQEIGKVVGYND